MSVVVYVTAPPSEGEKIAQFLVERKLAACVNIAQVDSIYRWEGRVERDREALLIIKTRAERLPELIRELKSVHPYKVPEIIALPIVDGNPDYLRWLEEATR
ncbi:MAG: divalent-cation tolerance protein CutA [Thermoproteus sp.]